MVVGIRSFGRIPGISVLVEHFLIPMPPLIPAVPPGLFFQSRARRGLSSYIVRLFGLEKEESLFSLMKWPLFLIRLWMKFFLTVGLGIG